MASERAAAIENAPTIDSKPVTPLMVAMQSGDLWTVELQIDSGARVEAASRAASSAPRRERNRLLLDVLEASPDAR